MMTDCSKTTQKLVLDFICQNPFQNMQKNFGQITILDSCNEMILEEKMTIVMSHPVIYAKNIHFGTSNLRVPYSGVYGPDGIQNIHLSLENFFML